MLEKVEIFQKVRKILKKYDNIKIEIWSVNSVNLRSQHMGILSFFVVNTHKLSPNKLYNTIHTVMEIYDIKEIDDITEGYDIMEKKIYLGYRYVCK